MNKENIDYRKILNIVLIGIFCYWGLNNYSVVYDFIIKILAVAMPFVIGLVIAFVLNVLMIRVEKIINKFSDNMSLKRIISIILSLLIVIGVISFVVTLIIPELTNAIKVIAKSLPTTFNNIQDWISENNNTFPSLEKWISNLDYKNLINEATNILKNGFTGMLGSTVDVISVFFNSIVNIIVGLVFAIYILMSKETLKRQTSKLISSLLPSKVTNELMDVAKLSRSTFSNFIIGQTLEAFILGSLCAIGMMILRLPYAPMIGSLVGITAFIPIVGAFIGGGVGAFMIMTIEPIQALIFIIFLVILQQIEGNLIYPKVVGSSVGLPSIWVLFAVIVGGGLFGIVGVLFGVPVVSVIYALIKKFVSRKQKNIES